MPNSRPANDELEICVFGPGVGECVVVHLGGGEWMIVDSCVDHDTGRPAALDYLTRIGVDVATAVRLVVVTHWHDDHIRGAATVVDAARAATFVCSQALRKSEFRELVAQSVLLNIRAAQSGVDEMRAIVTSLTKVPRNHDWAIADRLLFKRSATAQAPESTVFALSPSSAAVTRGLADVAQQLASRGTPKRAVTSLRPNDTCVVLSVRLGDAAVLLGADLETGNQSNTGWHAVLTTHARPASNALGFKVAHHGSKTAYHPAVWTQLLAPRAHAVLTPFTRSKLPGEADIARLKGHTSSVYCTARIPGKASFADAAVQKTVRDFAVDIRPRSGKMGWVRYRASGAGTPTVACFGAAFAA